MPDAPDHLARIDVTYAIRRWTLMRSASCNIMGKGTGSSIALPWLRRQSPQEKAKVAVTEELT